jgi:sugar phosphate isomerase/epimerase
MPASRPLSLHHLTALDTSPAELIAIAGTLGCDHVCLFTHVPEQARHVYPMVTAADSRAVAAALAAAGVRLHNLEVFPLTADVQLADFRDGLAVGASLGADRATAHVHVEDGAQAIDLFGRFCDLAAGYGLKVGLEFNGFSAAKTPARALEIEQAAGRANGDIALDFLHAVRSGADPAELAAIASHVGYAQICDGPADMPAEGRWREAIGDRMLPGDGDFPIAAMLAPLRRDVVIEVEVPQKTEQKAGVPPLDRARRAIDAARCYIQDQGADDDRR